MNWSPMLWGSNGKLNGFSFRKLGEDQMVVGRMGMMNNGGVNNGINGSSHSSTIERLYAWEKKLFHEVKVHSNSSFFYD